MHMSCKGLHGGMPAKESGSAEARSADDTSMIDKNPQLEVLERRLDALGGLSGFLKLTDGVDFQVLREVIVAAKALGALGVADNPSAAPLVRLLMTVAPAGGIDSAQYALEEVAQQSRRDAESFSEMEPSQKRPKIESAASGSSGSGHAPSAAPLQYAKPAPSDAQLQQLRADVLQWQRTLAEPRAPIQKKDNSVEHKLAVRISKLRSAPLTPQQTTSLASVPGLAEIFNVETPYQKLVADTRAWQRSTGNNRGPRRTRASHEEDKLARRWDDTAMALAAVNRFKDLARDGFTASPSLPGGSAWLKILAADDKAWSDRVGLYRGGTLSERIDHFKHILANDLDADLEARWDQLKQCKDHFFGILLRLSFKSNARIALQRWAAGGSLATWVENQSEILEVLKANPATTL